MEKERPPGARTHVTSLGTHIPPNPGWGEREAEAGGHLAGPSPEATLEALALRRGRELGCVACCCHLEAACTSAASVSPRPRGGGGGYGQQGDKAPWDL